MIRPLLLITGVKIMNKMLTARLLFILFSLCVVYLILSKTMELPIVMSVWVVGLVIFTRFRKRNKKEN